MRTIARIGTVAGAIVLGIGLVGYAGAAAQDQDSNNRQRPAFGRHGGPGGFGGPGGPGARIGPMGQMGLGRLNLTEAQQNQVQAIVESHREERQNLGEQAAAIRKTLNTAITSGTFDEASVRTASADLGRVETELAVLAARMHFEVLQTLTTEQQAQLAEMQADRQARDAERQERMRQRREQR